MTRSSALPPTRRTARTRRILPHWVPMLFISAFLVVIGVNATLIFFAEGTFSGLQTASPYERGLGYNETLAAEAAQERLGWQSEATISGGTGVQRVLRVIMTDRTGDVLPSLTLGAYFVRPSNEGLDLALTPQPVGDGSYVAAFALPAPGQWELRLVARDGDALWQHSERVFVK